MALSLLCLSIYLSFLRFSLPPLPLPSFHSLPSPSLLFSPSPNLSPARSLSSTTLVFLEIKLLGWTQPRYPHHGKTSFNLQYVSLRTSSRINLSHILFASLSCTSRSWLSPPLPSQGSLRMSSVRKIHHRFMGSGFFLTCTVQDYRSI